MSLFRSRGFASLTAACVLSAVALFLPDPDATPFAAGTANAAQKSVPTMCLTVADASKKSGKDVCVNAHVFDLIELTDGTRFLDVCPPDVLDDKCSFTLLSLKVDREDVGDLRRYRNQNVNVRGIVRSTHGRMGIVISHVRQFNGGPEKFRPNPKLLRDFNAQSDQMPVHDPNLASNGHHRSFMNTRDRETLPATTAH
jgi:hypothetical protein